MSTLSRRNVLSTVSASDKKRIQPFSKKAIVQATEKKIRQAFPIPSSLTQGQTEKQQKSKSCSKKLCCPKAPKGPKGDQGDPAFFNANSNADDFQLTLLSTLWFWSGLAVPLTTTVTNGTVRFSVTFTINCGIDANVTRTPRFNLLVNQDGIPLPGTEIAADSRDITLTDTTTINLTVGGDWILKNIPAGTHTWSPSIQVIDSVPVTYIVTYIRLYVVETSS